MFATIVLACLFMCALGQEDATAFIAPSMPASTISSEATSASRSTLSLFLPMGAPPQIYASVISAAPNWTAFALGCTDNTDVSDCGYAPPITVTEGESTIVFTSTSLDEGGEMIGTPLTVQCVLVGAHVRETPIEGATSAVCTSSSDIAGLGIAVSTSTLASTEINYVPVTVTAGLEKIIAAATSTPTTSSESSTAGAPARTALASIGLTGIVGLAVFRAF